MKGWTGLIGFESEKEAKRLAGKLSERTGYKTRVEFGCFGGEYPNHTILVSTKISDKALRVLRKIRYE